MAEEIQANRKDQGRAVIKYLRISPRKVRLVINTIRHKPVSTAFNTLLFLNKKAARMVEKGLKSAVASAKGNGLDEARLVVSEVKADGGPSLKRFMSRAMGRADQILKRTTHLTLILREGQRSFGQPSTQAASQKEEKKGKSKRLVLASAGKKTKAKAGAAQA